MIKDKDIFKKEVIFYLKDTIKKSVVIKSTLYLRGSIITKKSLLINDIDILIVSDYFNDISVIKRKDIINRYFQEEKYKIDALCLTYKEFSKIDKRHIKERMEKIYEYNKSKN